MDAVAADGLEAYALELIRSGSACLPARHADRPSEWVRGLLETDPGLFLERFGRLLSSEQVAAFRPLAADYAVSHFLAALTPPSDAHRTRNRRLQAAKRLIEARDPHFSAEAIADRDWELFTGAVGRHAAAVRSVDGEAASREAAGGALPSRLLSGMLLAAADGAGRSLGGPSVRRARGAPQAPPPRGDAGEGGEAHEAGVWAEPAPELDARPEESGSGAALGGAAAPPAARAVGLVGHTVAPVVAVASATGGQPATMPLTGDGMGRGAMGDEEEDEDDEEEAGEEGGVAASRDRLLRAAVRRFVSGADAASFDYAAVDGDASLDVSEEAARDAEDAWFDGEGGA